MVQRWKFDYDNALWIPIAVDQGNLAAPSQITPAVALNNGPRFANYSA